MSANETAGTSIAISDRGFAYGDGLFETILIHGHQPILFEEHMARLQAGADRLRIPLDRPALDADIAGLMPLPEQGVLKIVVTRGSGGRGYRPAENMTPTRALTLHSLPDYRDNQPEQGIAVFICKQRLAIQPALAGLKHLNRLEQVLASMEWPDDSVMEGLMLDMDGNVIEGTRSNLFWTEGGRLLTPALDRCGVDGIMRQYLIRQLPNVEIIDHTPLDRVMVADQVFVCNSVFGIWPVTSVYENGREIPVGNDGTTTDFITLARQAVADLLASQDDD